MAVGERGGGAAAHAGEQHLQDPDEDGLLGGRVADLEAAAGDGLDDGAHGVGHARAPPGRHEVQGEDLVQGGERGAGDGRAGLVGADDVEEGAEVEERVDPAGPPAEAAAPGGGAAAERLEARDERVVEVLVLGGIIVLVVGCSRSPRGYSHT